MVQFQGTFLVICEYLALWEIKQWISYLPRLSNVLRALQFEANGYVWNYHKGLLQGSSWVLTWSLNINTSVNAWQNPFVQYGCLNCIFIEHVIETRMLGKHDSKLHWKAFEGQFKEDIMCVTRMTHCQEERITETWRFLVYFKAWPPNHWTCLYILVPLYKG